MKKRYICQACLGLVFFLWILSLAAGEKGFPRLGASLAEERLAEGGRASVQGRVCQKRKKEDGWELCLDRVRLDAGAGEARDLGKERIRVRLGGAQLPEEAEPARLPAIGQYVRVSGRVSFPKGPANPGNFDRRFQERLQGITAALYEGRIEQIRGGPGGFREALWRGKKKAADLAVHYLGEERGALLSAMLLGDALPVPEAERELYQKSGIAHVLSLSGLHFSFLGMGLYRLLRKGGMPLGAASLFSTGLMGIYAAMVGERVSVIRAAVMFALRMGAILSGREYDGPTALAAAAGVTLIRNPLYLFDAGFLLSYGAVLGIYLWAPLLAAKQSGGTVRRGLALSLAIHLVILPVLLFYYFEFCVYSPFWNLLVTPMMAGVLGCGAAGLFLGGVSALAAALPACSLLSGAADVCARLAFGLAGRILAFYGAGCALVLELPGARWVAGRPRMWQIAGYAALVAAAFWLLRRKAERRRRAGRLAAPWLCMAAALFVLALPQGRPGETEVAMLQVGQGDCFFIRGPRGGAHLIDGGSSSVREVGKYRLEPFLKSRGVGQLDTVWVSHGDLDHLNGIAELLDRRKVGVGIRRLILPEQAFWDETLEELADRAERQGVPVLTVEQGQVFREGDLELACLWPEARGEAPPGADAGPAAQDGETAEAGNQASMVLSLTCGSFSMLFTGDLDREGEQRFAARMERWQEEGALPARYEVLKVGHHGSRFATGEELLERVRPRAAWISAGENNRYGHPHPEVLERLANWDASIYNTKDGNAVILYTDGKKYGILRP